MKKRIIPVLLSLILLLPSVFCFSASADSLDFVGPIPSNYFNRDYGTTLDWYHFDRLGAANIYCDHFYMSAAEQKYWNHISGDLGTRNITHFEYVPTTGNQASTSVWVTIEFSSMDAWGYFFSLSNSGYTQFWFDIGVMGYNSSGQAAILNSISCYFYGDKYAAGGILNDYVKVTNQAYLVPTDGLTRIKNNYWTALGATLTSNVMRSTTINSVVLEIKFNSEVSKADIWMGGLQFRKYTTSGDYVSSDGDGSGSGGGSGSTDAPNLDEDTKNKADLEGDIQNSIAQGNDEINSNINNVNENINNRLDDLKNDDMGYTGNENPEMDEGLDAGDSLLDTMNNALDDFDDNIDSASKTLSEGLNGFGEFIAWTWNGLPTVLTGLVSAVVIFIVVRKVVGR